MSVVNGYCTATELRTHLGDSGSALTAELLERAINAASRSVDRYCGRRFWKDAVVTTRKYRVSACGFVYVDDISTRTGLVVAEGTDGITFGSVRTAGTDFILDPANADVLASGDTADPYAFWKLTAIDGFEFTTGYDYPTLQVTAKFGWSSTPYEVVEATILKAASLFKRKDSPNGVAGFGEFGVVRVGKFDPDVIDLLSPFCKPGFA